MACTQDGVGAVNASLRGIHPSDLEMRYAFGAPASSILQFVIAESGLL